MYEVPRAFYAFQTGYPEMKLFLPRVARRAMSLTIKKKTYSYIRIILRKKKKIVKRKKFQENLIDKNEKIKLSQP